MRTKFFNAPPSHAAHARILSPLIRAIALGPLRSILFIVEPHRDTKKNRPTFSLSRTLGTIAPQSCTLSKTRMCTYLCIQRGSARDRAPTEVRRVPGGIVGQIRGVQSCTNAIRAPSARARVGLLLSLARVSVNDASAKVQHAPAASPMHYISRIGKKGECRRGEGITVGSRGGPREWFIAGWFNCCDVYADENFSVQSWVNVACAARSIIRKWLVLLGRILVVDCRAVTVDFRETFWSVVAILGCVGYACMLGSEMHVSLL